MVVGHNVNICFHGVGTPDRELEPGEGIYWTSPQFLEDVLDLAASDPSIELSFDDGNSSDLELALPALKARNLTASFFVLAGRLDQSGSLDAAAVRTLAEQGMTIGCHGMHHKPWRTLSDLELEAEFVEARDIIAAISGTTIDLAACPLGSYDRRVLANLRKHPYRHVFTSDRSIARPGAWLQPRFSVRSTDTVADLHAFVQQAGQFTNRVLSAARIAVKRLR